LDRYVLHEKNQADIIGMQVGYVGPDEREWHGSYGLKNYKTGASVNDSTLFMIASSAKPVTALAILKLHDNGKLRLDDDVSRYLPFSVVNPHSPDASITFRMLLSHTGTVQDNWEVMDPLYTLKKGGDSPLKLSDFVRNYFTKSGDYYYPGSNFYDETPGQYWSYSNMGHALLGYAVEEVSGLSFSEYMDQNIFRPLEMSNSYWLLRNIPHQNMARPHQWSDPEDEGNGLNVLPHYGYPDFPDGQLRTTTRDYLKFIKLILNGGRANGKQFISENLAEQFYTVQYPSAHEHQAVAFNYNEFDNWMYYMLMRRLPSHTGGDPGVASVVTFDPEQKTAAVVLANSPPRTFLGGKSFYLDLPKRLLREGAK
jgi:CubicO group peptidase (beta-lactamase class C family)